MASVSAPGGAKAERLSFAKIAAAGIKPSSRQNISTNNNTSNIRIQGTSSLMHDDPQNVTPSNTINAQPPVRLAQPGMRDSKEIGNSKANGPQVQAPAAKPDVPSPHHRPTGASTLTPVPDEITQLSSSSESMKPPSLDGKSVTSGTTFALDEKESLRPDDSASVKAAAEDEDALSTAVSGLPGSHVGSDDGVRAFRDQLREIHTMDQSRSEPMTSGFDATSAAPHGLLYGPPHDPNAGTLAAAPIGLPSHREERTEILPDLKLLEALESPRDRIWVLKLEQDIIDFVKDTKESSLNLPQCNSFYRMLAHKIADYYMLGHAVDDSVPAVRLFRTPNCRIPPPLTGIQTPSTAASTPPPAKQQLKILRRGDGAGSALANGSNITSKTTSETGDSGGEEGKSKAPVSREEREARYEAARLRIMGSAKPVEALEASKEPDESRASSTTGKKTSKRNKRTNSDDDFESRSNYNTYFPQTAGATAVSPAQFGFGPNPSTGTSSPASFAPHEFQQAQIAPGPIAPGGMWQYLPNADFTPTWTQNPQQPFDLAGDFQRSMTLQQQPFDNSVQYQYNNPYGHQHYVPQQGWPQQQFAPQYPTAQAQFPMAYQQQVQSQHASSPAQMPQPQPYAFGQLPSQAFPGRPPSKLEHPLPGSYKNQHFNPQSQTFVPGQSNGPPRTFAPPRTPSGQALYGSGYSMHGQAQTPAQRQPQGPLYSSPQANMPLPARYPNQQMVHPLPQPVFPQQPSPALPLPPKPQMASHRSNDGQSQVPLAAPSNGTSGSSISKWGVPASLPAKPPPANDSLDTAKLAQAQRHPSLGASPNAKPSAGVVPTFGSMPFAATGTAIAPSQPTSRP